MPLFGLARMWFWGLLTVGVLVAAGFLLRRWADELPDPRATPSAGEITSPDDNPQPAQFRYRLAAWRPGWDKVTALLSGAVALTVLSAGGGRGLLWLLLPKGGTAEQGREGETFRLKRPDGSDLHVEVSGPANGPLVVLIHGWGTSAAAWGHLRRHLHDRYRVVAYDLRGTGRSYGPRNRDFGMDRHADDVCAVIDAVGGGPAVLIGHSIGGMIQLNVAKVHPEVMGTRVAGLIIVDSTPTNPTRTTEMGGLLAALQKPVLEPLAWVMVALAPLVWVMNVLSYLNGSSHWSNYRTSFSWKGTWEQLDFVTRYPLELWPGAYARGCIGMFRYDAADVLGSVRVPTLVVVGDRDRVTVPAAAEAIRRGIPGAELVTVSSAGHMVPIQRPDELAGVVRGFLDRHHPISSPVEAASATPQGAG
jgi:pimeloyl-ACP methyl ester carboxylesterase